MREGIFTMILIAIFLSVFLIQEAVRAMEQQHICPIYSQEESTRCLSSTSLSNDENSIATDYSRHLKWECATNRMSSSQLATKLAQYLEQLSPNRALQRKLIEIFKEIVLMAPQKATYRNNREVERTRLILGHICQELLEDDSSFTSIPNFRHLFEYFDPINSYPQEPQPAHTNSTYAMQHTRTLTVPMQSPRTLIKNIPVVKKSPKHERVAALKNPPPQGRRSCQTKKPSHETGICDVS